MFETFDDILNRHIYVPSNFSGIAISNIHYLITSVNTSIADDDSIYGKTPPSRYQYSVDFEVSGVYTELSNNNE